MTVFNGAQTKHRRSHVMAIEGSGPPLPRKKEMKIYAAVQRICVVVQVWMARLANSAHKA